MSEAFSKPFLTITEQVRLLESRGLSTDSATAKVLMREGYYSIVNGYKDPFINSEATAAAGDDRYLSSATFSDLDELFQYDRELRELTFHYLIRAEATVRTAVSYCFSDAHREPEAYLLQSNYCSQEEFESYGNDPADYAKEIAGLTSILSKQVHHSRSEFVAHYRDDYGAVPLWVLANDLTFGNLEHFFNLMKPQERSAFCKHVAISTGRLGDKRLGYFDPIKAKTALEAMVKFRNICAHDERLYCARVGGRKDINYAKMVWMLERFLTSEEFFAFLEDFIVLLDEVSNKAGGIGHVLQAVGFSELMGEIQRRAGQ